MVKESRTVGRPRTFDETAVVQQAVTTFWTHGGTNTTMKVLEREIGLMPASIYNAFGSKQQLLHLAVENYLGQMAEELLTPLESPDAGQRELVEFIDELVEWVTNPDHPGCLMLNLLGEHAQRDEALLGFADRHRTRLRTALQPVLVSIDPSQAEARAHLLAAAVMGMSVAARGGADQGEMVAIAGSLQDQIKQWSKP